MTTPMDVDRLAKAKPRKRDKKRRASRERLAVATVGALLSAQFTAPLALAKNGGDQNTATPIKHIIVLIGENRSFDHTYATYQPKHGQSVSNLLSKQIILADGSPGPNAALANQFTVNTPLPPTYFISVSAANKTAYSPHLPTPELGGAPDHAISQSELDANPTGVQPPFDQSISETQLDSLEPALESKDIDLLRTGETGAGDTSGLDPRVTNGSALPNTVFQLTGASLPYDSYTGDMVHRLFHMWQQSDCDVTNATPSNPSGCLNDLYPFVGIARGDDSGSSSMGFYNMQNGDAPLLKRLADKYTLSDNFHQSVMGGTAANHVALGTGDFIFWTTFNGLTQPPANIANPNPTSSTSDKYTSDKQWTECADPTQPGILPIVDYLDSLPYHPASKCEAGLFYMINNLSPGFLPNGQIDTASISAGKKVPPSPLRTIGDELNENGLSWAYYGGGYNAAVRVANGSSDPFDQLIATNYCDICNFASYTTSIMGDATQRAEHIKDAIDFFSEVQAGELPAISFVKPDSFVDGHPASSKLDLFEGMLDKILGELQKHPQLAKETALFVAFDEGGGYWDSGYFEPLDFFGDGPRIPFLVISHYSRGGRVVHTYYDHVSILKFIERNWGLAPLTARSRDNLPNPVTAVGDPYVPVNPPALGDLMDMFDFHS